MAARRYDRQCGGLYMRNVEKRILNYQIGLRPSTFLEEFWQAVGKHTEEKSMSITKGGGNSSAIIGGRVYLS